MRSFLAARTFNDARPCLRGHEFPVTGPAAAEAGTCCGSYVSFVSVDKDKTPLQKQLNEERVYSAHNSR